MAIFRVIRHLRSRWLAGLILVFSPPVAAAEPDLVESTQNGAYTAARVVMYGLENEIEDPNDLTQAKFLMKGTRACLDGIAELRRSDPAKLLDINGQGELSLDEVESRFCKPALALLEPVLGGAIAADEAKYAGLSKERVDAWKTYNLGDWTVYGPGKQVLTTNAQKQAARAWFIWDHDRSYVVPHWWLVKFSFSNGSYVKTKIEGQGVQPPASMFR